MKWPLPALTIAISLLSFPAFIRTQPAADSALQMLGGMDAATGEAVFREKGCFDCHSYDGKGGSEGPDLGTNRIRGTSPAALAAAMWNHAPTMWRSFGGASAAPSLNSREAAALYSFFYSRLYFDEFYPNVQH